MYKICVKNLTLNAIIGILEAERTHPQSISVNLTCIYADKEKYVDYMELVDFVKKSLLINKYLLIEDGIDDMSSKLKKIYPNISSIYIEITKLDILDDAQIGVSNEC